MTEERPKRWLARAWQWLLPPRRNRLVPYGPIEVLVAFFLAGAFWPAACFLLVTETGLGDAVFGPGTVLRARTEEARNLSLVRLALFAGMLALPLRVLSVPFSLRLLTGTHLYQIGATVHRLKRNALLGLLGCMTLTPLVLGINWLANQAFSHLSPESVTEHPLTRLGQSETVRMFELGMVVFLATVAAPVVEELLFRGVLLTWLEGHAARSDLAMAAAGVYPLWLLVSKWGDFWAGDWTVLAPALFVAAMVPAYLWVRRKQRTPARTALYASSMLFAMFHQEVWPSPIPLFVLALGLGWLAQRTRSLVGPMVLHSLFNGVAVVQMLTGNG